MLYAPLCPSETFLSFSPESILQINTSNYQYTLFHRILLLQKIEL